MKKTSQTQQKKSMIKKKSAKKKQTQLSIPKHIWYETVGVFLILLACITIGKFGWIGIELFSWSGYLFGLFAPIFWLAMAMIGCLIIWYQEQLHFSLNWFAGISIFIVGQVCMSALNVEVIELGVSLTNVQTLQEQGWITLLDLGGGVIGTTVAQMSIQLIGRVGTLLLSGMIIILFSLFIRQKSLAESVAKTFDQTKKTVDKAQNQMNMWQQNRGKKQETHTFYDVEAVEKKQTSPLFPDDFFTDHRPTAKHAVETKAPLMEENENMEGLEVHIAKTETIIEREFDEQGVSGKHRESSAYELPPITLLKDVPATDLSQMKETIEEHVDRLHQLFTSFKIGITISAVNIGPAITQYEIQPDPGVKVSRIVNLSSDIALSLAAKDVRIVAPIPGKAAIGIEVPNPVVAMVSLKQTLTTTYDRPENRLLVALGKDISGETVTAQLDKMPHLLVAGSTGSGKSVCINGIITSILMRTKPEEVKLLLIDPKKVELSYFNHIPHLLAPVVTDPKKAAFALRKIVQEMEERYELFAQNGVRNIEGYNKQAESGSELPFIVVIIDELADLMLVASKDVEESIMRITQMARAAGIHLIVATQRPSVDVITGVIKANIPSRIAFAVSSQIDSRTILDMSGAEALVGKGDMLFFPSGESKPLRVQGAYVSEQEVMDVVDFIKAQQPTIQYDEQLLAIAQATNLEAELENTGDSDTLLPEVIQFVIEQQKASTSLIQRRFKVGYNRAARLMEMMEAKGIIGPNEGTKPRQVLQLND